MEEKKTADWRMAGRKCERQYERTEVEERRRGRRGRESLNWVNKEGHVMLYSKVPVRR